MRLIMSFKVLNKKYQGVFKKYRKLIEERSEKNEWGKISNIIKTIINDMDMKLLKATGFLDFLFVYIQTYVNNGQPNDNQLEPNEIKKNINWTSIREHHQSKIKSSVSEKIEFYLNKK